MDTKTAKNATRKSLRDVRKDRGFSQVQMGVWIGVCTPVYAEIEAGERSPTIEQRDALAAHLKLKPADIERLLEAASK